MRPDRSHTSRLGDGRFNHWTSAVVMTDSRYIVMRFALTVCKTLENMIKTTIDFVANHLSLKHHQLKIPVCFAFLKSPFCLFIKMLIYIKNIIKCLFSHDVVIVISKLYILDFQVYIIAR